MADEYPASRDIRQIVVQLPAFVDDEGLFEVVCDAVHDWEPEQRDGWDVDVHGTVITICNHCGGET